MLSARETRIPIFGIIAALVASISLGIVTPAARVAYDYGTSATTLVAFRAAFAVSFMAIVIPLLSRPWCFESRAFKPLLQTTMGILMVAFGYMSSVLFIPVSLSALIFFTFPIVVLFYTTTLNSKPQDLVTILAFLAAFTGLALTLGPNLEVLDWRGVLCSTVAVIGASLVMVAGSTAVRRLDPFTLTFYTQLLCLPIVFGVLLASENVSLPFHVFGWAALFIAAGGYIVGICLILLALRFAKPARVSMINNLEPLVTLVTAALVLDERLSLPQYLGGGLVLGSVIIATRTMTKPSVDLSTR